MDLWYIPASYAAQAHVQLTCDGGDYLVERVAIDTKPEIDRLEQERQETLAEIERLRIDLRNLAEPTADDADLDAYEREKTWAMVQTAQRRLEAIDRALEMAHNGSYGVCQTCGERIDRARLEILPTTTLCLRCQREYERRNKRRR
jgi:DnaK suppressor protein